MTLHSADTDPALTAVDIRTYGSLTKTMNRDDSKVSKETFECYVSFAYAQRARCLKNTFD